MSSDQAQNLRELVKNEKRCKTIFFMSCKEKIGQTVSITNIATLLSENNYKTLILDSGAGFFRTDVLLNVFPKYGIKSIMNNNELLDEVLVNVDDNLQVLYARTIFEEIQTSEEMLKKLQKYLNDLRQDYDFILVDLENVHIESIKEIIDLNTRILFTLNTGDLDCLKRTYATIKDIQIHTETKEVNIIINKVNDKSVADEFYQRLKIASDKFLGVQVENMGYISNDEKIAESLKEQKPIVKIYKDSQIYNDFKDIFSQMILN